MQRKCLSVWWQVLTVCALSLAAWAPVYSESLNWWTFTARDGVPSTYSITALHESRDGRVWCATEGGGVGYFDGYAWRVLHQSAEGLSDDCVKTMYERPDGTLWFATRRGVSVYHLRRNQWVTADYPFLRPLSRLFITDIVEQPSETLWFGTDDGLYRCDLNRSNPSPEKVNVIGGDPRERNAILTLFAQSSGALWICSIDGSVRVLHPTGAMDVIQEAGSRVISAREWSDGTLWFGLDGVGGFRIYDSKRPPEQRWVWRDLRSLLSATSGPSVRDMVEMPNGERYLTVNDYGILIFGADGKFRNRLHRGNSGLVSDQVSAACRRSDGTLYFDMGLGFGISVHDPDLLQAVSGTQDKSQHLTWDANNVYVRNATLGTVRTVARPPALMKTSIRSIVEDDEGALWVGTMKGLKYYSRDGKWQVPPARPPDVLMRRDIKSLHYQRNGTLYIGTWANGLYTYRRDRGWRFEPSKISGAAQHALTRNARAICETKDGTLYFGTEDGLVQQRGNRWHLFTAENTQGGLSHTVINALAELPDGRLAIGTDGGISFYDDKANVWSSLTPQEGFVDGECSELRVLDDGRLRFTTILPLRQYDLRLPAPPETYLIVGDAVFAQSSTHRKHAYRLQPTSSRQVGTIAQQPVVAAPLGERVVRSSRLTVQAFGVSPGRRGSAGEFRYQFALDGKPLPWQTQPLRTFSNLSNGAHVITVRACDRFLNIDPTPAVLNVRVQRPLPSWVLWTMGSGLTFALLILGLGLATHRQRVERVRLRHELKVGHDIQTSFLPREQMQHGEYEIVSRYLPAIEVGGDFYDVFPLSDDKIGIVIGDVSGKGVGGAMYMSVAITLTEALGREVTMPPSDVLKRTNRHLFPKLQQQRMMVTMFYGVLDIREHTLTFSNAGQGYPLLSRNGESRYLEHGGIPLGGFEQPMYEDHTISIPLDATLVLYSDGFVEMVGANGELLGFDRFQQMVAKYAHLPVPQMIGGLLDTTVRFGDRRFERDDLTLVIIKRTGGR